MPNEIIKQHKSLTLIGGTLNNALVFFVFFRNIFDPETQSGTLPIIVSLALGGFAGLIQHRANLKSHKISDDWQKQIACISRDFENSALEAAILVGGLDLFLDFVDFGDMSIRILVGFSTTILATAARQLQREYKKSRRRTGDSWSFFFGCDSTQEKNRAMQYLLHILNALYQSAFTYFATREALKLIDNPALDTTSHPTLITAAIMGALANIQTNDVHAAQASNPWHYISLFFNNVVTRNLVFGTLLFELQKTLIANPLAPNTALTLFIADLALLLSGNELLFRRYLAYCGSLSTEESKMRALNILGKMAKGMVVTTIIDEANINLLLGSLVVGLSAGVLPTLPTQSAAAKTRLYQIALITDDILDSSVYVALCSLSIRGRISVDHHLSYYLSIFGAILGDLFLLQPASREYKLPAILRNGFAAATFADNTTQMLGATISILYAHTNQTPPWLPMLVGLLCAGFGGASELVSRQTQRGQAINDEEATPLVRQDIPKPSHSQAIYHGIIISYALNLIFFSQQESPFQSSAGLNWMIASYIVLSIMGIFFRRQHTDPIEVKALQEPQSWNGALFQRLKSGCITATSYVKSCASKLSPI